MRLRLRHVKSWLCVAIAASLAACGSTPVNVGLMPPAKYEKLGRVQGKGCGALGLLATAFYAVPMGLGSRTEMAYKDALSKAPGATSLINVEIEETWSWALLVTARCTTITGDAIKEIEQ